jgi:hypothetical protein
LYNCIPIHKANCNRYGQFKIAQIILNKKMMAKERRHSSLQAKQSVLDLTSPGKRAVSGEMKIVESKDLTLLLLISFTRMLCRSMLQIRRVVQFACQEWYDLYVRPYLPEVALVAMRVLSQVISASSCESNCSWPNSLCATGSRQLRPSSWFTFIPIGRQWQQQLVMTS